MLYFDGEVVDSAIAEDEMNLKFNLAASHLQNKREGFQLLALTRIRIIPLRFTTPEINHLG